MSGEKILLLAVIAVFGTLILSIVATILVILSELVNDDHPELIEQIKRGEE